MQVAHAHATFVTPDTVDESLTTIVARSVLEAALQNDGTTELWFELAAAETENVSRLSIDLAHSDIEELLSLSSEDEIALSLDGEEMEALFSDYDVEAHGLKGAIAIAVTSAALLAPAANAAVPQTASPAATVQRAQVAATAQVRTAATTQVVSAQARLAKSQPAKLAAFKLLRSGLVR